MISTDFSWKKGIPYVPKLAIECENGCMFSGEGV
jgi:hypothetical protein